jgi:hypothetical protein
VTHALTTSRRGVQKGSKLKRGRASNAGSRAEAGPAARRRGADDSDGRQPPRPPAIPRQRAARATRGACTRTARGMRGAGAAGRAAPAAPRSESGTPPRGPLDGGRPAPGRSGGPPPRSRRRGSGRGAQAERLRAGAGPMPAAATVSQPTPPRAASVPARAEWMELEARVTRMALAGALGSGQRLRRANRSHPPRLGDGMDPLWSRGTARDLEELTGEPTRTALWGTQMEIRMTRMTRMTRITRACDPEALACPNDRDSASRAPAHPPIRVSGPCFGPAFGQTRGSQAPPSPPAGPCSAVPPALPRLGGTP